MKRKNIQIGHTSKTSFGIPDSDQCVHLFSAHEAGTRQMNSL